MSLTKQHVLIHSGGSVAYELLFYFVSGPPYSLFFTQHKHK